MSRFMPQARPALMPPSKNVKTKRSDSTAFAEGGLFRFVQALAAMLLAARWLVPAESAVFGDTLWIVQLWFLLVLVWGWDAYRRFDGRLQLDGLDLAVGVLVLGHVISTLWVLAGNGEQRSALNLMWEWVGLGASFFLLRQLLRTRDDGRRLIHLMLAAAVMLAGLGIWQHYVELPELVAKYEDLAGRLAENPSDLKTRQELAELGVPQTSTARALWENRLKSTEPFATFALANTLAGFLAAWLFVGLDAGGIGRLFSHIRPRFTWKLAARWAALVLVAYCLVLTKSRTAWAGFLAGIFLWMAVLHLGNQRESAGPEAKDGDSQTDEKTSRRWWILGAGVGGLGILLFVIAAVSGGFDRQVLSEAPKSLNYRLQYWTGAGQVVKEHPWLGTGPGNFRQHYLKHKLPESSEEIADPHNWILDLWTSGGLLALLGFLGLIVLVIPKAGRSRDPNESRTDSRGISAWEIGAGLAFPAVMLALWLTGEPVKSSLLWLFGGWGLACWIFHDRNQSPWPRAGILAGGFAILVHLLGAGGIEMPAVVQTIFVLVILLDPRDWKTSPEGVRSRPKTVLAISLAAVIAFGLCLVTATMPCWYRSIYLASGDAVLGQEKDFLEAERFYEKARTADPYSPEPVERLAELAFRRWQASAKHEDFDQAVQWAQGVIALDPASHRGYHRLGTLYFQQALRRGSVKEAKTALSYFSKAVARYPTSPLLRAEFAFALDFAGKTEAAGEQADRALALDQINLEAGHSDKYLPGELVKELERLRQ